MNVLNKIYDSRLGRTRQIDRGRRRVRDGRYSAARKVKDAVDYEYLTAYARQMANDIINGYIDAEMPFDRSARDLAMDLFEIECDNGDMSEEELDAYDEITAEVAYEVLNDPATSRMIDEHNASLSDGIEDSRRPSRLRSSRVRDGRLASRSRYLRVGR